MIICNKCFRDIEIVPIIEGIGQIGNCSVCNTKNAYIYDTEKNSELVGYFEELISIYTPARLLPSTFPKSETFDLKNELKSNWSIFNNLSTKQIYELLVSLCSDKYKENPELFDNPIGLAELHNLEYLNQHSLLRTNSWDDFVLALKTKNRYHTHHINTDILRRYCTYIRKVYRKGMIFYRGRISSPLGYNPDEMSAPPFELANAGRVNAPGIRCLYLANDIATTIHETRAGAFDFISIGEFELQDDIVVVDLRSINKISPFIEDLDYTEHAINKDHLNKINEEMGKALRRSDSPLDYVPTQYISDFIKSIYHGNKPEYAGIEYNSTMNTAGYNVAVFYPDLFKCNNVNVYKVKDLVYSIVKYSE